MMSNMEIWKNLSINNSVEHFPIEGALRRSNRHEDIPTLLEQEQKTKKEVLFQLRRFFSENDIQHAYNERFSDLFFSTNFK